MEQFPHARRSFGLLHQRSQHASGRRSDGSRSRWRLLLRCVSLIPAMVIAVALAESAVVPSGSIGCLARVQWANTADRAADHAGDQR